MGSIVIAGAGHSGGRLAHLLRKKGYEGKIILIGDENVPPYDRPPLSKAYLQNEKTLEQCFLYPADSYGALNIQLCLNTRVEMIDRAEKVVTTADGTNHPYSKLIISTGAEPNFLAGLDTDDGSIHYLRSADDAARLKRALLPGLSVLVIGAGFIGLEVAASAVQTGCSVHISERGDRILQRLLVPEASALLRERHEQQGVSFSFNNEILEIRRQGNKSTVKFADGRKAEYDVIVAGIGVTPRTQLAEKAGLSVKNGIVVNDKLQSSDADIYAIGDVASFPSALSGGPVRLESWKNAEDQVKVVAADICGEDASYNEVPWFWSNQFDFSVQITGLPNLGTESVVMNKSDCVLFFSTDSNDTFKGLVAIGNVKSFSKYIRKAKDIIKSGTLLCDGVLLSEFK